ncbi:hypothetical protein [Ferruginibacter sp.]|nr:hypothetical protein [Ferruginibacter sp.]
MKSILKTKFIFVYEKVFGKTKKPGEKKEIISPFGEADMPDKYFHDEDIKWLLNSFPTDIGIGYTLSHCVSKPMRNIAVARLGMLLELVKAQETLSQKTKNKWFKSAYNFLKEHQAEVIDKSNKEEIQLAIQKFSENNYLYMKVDLENIFIESIL